MSWWEIALIVWLGGDIFLSLNHLIRTKRANLVPFTLGVVVQSFYDSLFWPIFLVMYGLAGMKDEIFGGRFW